METKPVPTPLPIGHSFFDRVIEGGYYYVDKTLLIKELLDKGATVTLCTRPRRFGKTLNQTMLKCFFEDTAPLAGTIYGKDMRPLFNGLNIEKAGERYMDHQGRYPVIFMNFKEGKRVTFEDSYSMLKDQLREEFQRHKYAFEKISSDKDKALLKAIVSGKGTIKEYAASLRFLTKCLESYHNQKTVIIIDEYDVPLENAWVRGFYDEMINFLRPLLSDALKDNPHLQFAVITGCLRISKESIFTGLNNLAIVSILSDEFNEDFGFTQKEVDAMLEHYDLMGKREIIKGWYNGYIFGNSEVYNPWSTVNVVKNWIANIDRLPEPHWANTSSNDIVRKLVDKADSAMKEDIETLLTGGTISKAVHEDITYDEIDNDPQNMWNFLFFTGYLKKVGEGRMDEDDDEITIDLMIPNREVRYIYNRKIKEWFRDQVKSKDLTAFFKGVIDGDAEVMQRELTVLLKNTISFMDSAENFYHGFLAGILSQCPDGYIAKSNRESGNGRSDLYMCAVNPMTGKAFIFEVKPAKEKDGLPIACDSALKQIDDNDYSYDLIDQGYEDITKYGIAFYRKLCMVKVA